jgi:hypothetical protein
MLFLLYLRSLTQFTSLLQLEEKKAMLVASKGQAQVFQQPPHKPSFLPSSKPHKAKHRVRKEEKGAVNQTHTK